MRDPFRRIRVSGSSFTRRALSLIILGLSPWLVSAQSEKAKILHIMSYSADLSWSSEQFEGFKEGLAMKGAEYRLIELDAKRKTQSSWFERLSKEIDIVIDSWKPSLVYASDDEAQNWVTRRYAGSELPIIFSGLNSLPAVYGLSDAPNVSGVLEDEHFTETMELLKKIAPKTRRIALVIDESRMWNSMIERMKAHDREDGSIEILRIDSIRTFAEFKKRIASYPEEVDAVGLLGVFLFKDEDERFVPHEEVHRWAAENLSIPDFSFWDDRVRAGTLCASVVSGREQGRTAGEIAREVLIEGKSPSSIPIVSSTRGEAVVNLARAGRLCLRIEKELLEEVRVYSDFSWEKER
jgi:ABC-type uncharacterized transport system substrate-binding protein